jgi:hypothetical protein
LDGFFAALKVKIWTNFCSLTDQRSLKKEVAAVGENVGLI